MRIVEYKREQRLLDDAHTNDYIVLLQKLMWCFLSRML